MRTVGWGTYLLPSPFAEGELHGWSLCGFSVDGDSIGHSFIATIHILLRYVVEGDVAVIVFQVRKSPFGECRQILGFVAVGTRVAGAGLVSGVAVC